jgi:hypothetical protein
MSITDQRMVRVLRASVPGLDHVGEAEMRERIAACRGLAPEDGRRVTEHLSRALQPDFAGAKVHHRSHCWWVDAYEAGRWGKPRQFVLVRADAVPDSAGRCEYCDSGHPKDARRSVVPSVRAA